MEKGKIIPFYMAYPLPLYYEDEQEVVKDMEYLQSQHSPEIRSLQREIMEVINLLDYEGSMIYDEYPDRYSLRAIVLSIQKVLEKEEEDSPSEEMIQILLLNEIYKRRHGSRRGRISSYF